MAKPVDRQRSLFMLMIVQLITNFRGGIISPILSLFVRSQGLSLAQIGLLGTASMLGWFIWEPFMGVIADRWNKRWMLAGSLLLTTILYGVYPMAQGLGFFMVLEFLKTSIMSAYSIPVKALAAELLPTEDRGFYKWQSLGKAKTYPGVGKWEVTPEEAAKAVRKACKFYGAGNTGFTKLDKRWVYSHTRYGKPIVFEDVEEGYTTEEKAIIPESHKWAIVLTVPMDLENFMHTPSATESVSGFGYSQMHFLGGMVAEFIRGLGYHAVPCGNDTALSVPMAIQAGLGHLGRHGRLRTWKHGSMCRILKVFTDLPLAQSPMAPGGIVEFCEDCKKCAKLCPSQSISSGRRSYEAVSDANNPGTLKWYVDAESCLDHWNVVESGCGICFRVCSFNKKPGPHHDVVKWFIRNVPALNKFWAWSDDLMGYGKRVPPERFWE